MMLIVSHFPTSTCRTIHLSIYSLLNCSYSGFSSLTSVGLLVFDLIHRPLFLSGKYGDHIREPEAVYADFLVRSETGVTDVPFAGWGTDEGQIVSILAHRNAEQRRVIRKVYAETYGEDLLKSLDKELSQEFEVEVFHS